MRPGLDVGSSGDAVDPIRLTQWLYQGKGDGGGVLAVPRGARVARPAAALRPAEGNIWSLPVCLPDSGMSPPDRLLAKISGR